MSPRKIQKYGQHFLISPRVIEEIVGAAEVLKAENLVEIGPGQGALTQALIAQGRTHFTVIEIDPEMVQFLRANLPPVAGIHILEQNFLQFDLSFSPSFPLPFRYHLISVLPFPSSLTTICGLLVTKK